MEHVITWNKHNDFLVVGDTKDFWFRKEPGDGVDIHLQMFRKEPLEQLFDISIHPTNSQLIYGSFNDHDSHVNAMAEMLLFAVEHYGKDE